jgi:hypothetical protein
MVHVPLMFISEWREFPMTLSISSNDIGEVGRAKDLSALLYVNVDLHHTENDDLLK